MKTSALAIALLCSWAVVCNAQQAEKALLLPPTLTMAKRSADGKQLEIQRHVSEIREEAYTVQVPVTIVEMVDGEERTRTVLKPQQVTRTVQVTKPVFQTFAFDSVQFRTVKGGGHTPEDAAKLITEEPKPVIVVERFWDATDGKQAIGIRRFDTAYLKLFQPDALIVMLPPPEMTPAPQGPAGPLPAPAAPPAPPN